MTSPLKLPPIIKQIGRTLRDHPVSNNLITALVRPVVHMLPESVGQRLKAHVPRVGSATATLPDGKTLRLRCNQPESILNSIFYDGWTAEEDEVLPLWRLLASEARVVLDIGAHIGHFTLVAALTNPKAKIYSFEPLPRVHALLKDNLQINRISNVDARQMALGRQAGRLPFYAVPEGIPSSSSLSKSFMESSDAVITQVEVEVSTLDAQDVPATAPMIIKIDTETTEPDVIAGGGELIRSANPMIIVEVLAGHDFGARLEQELRAARFDHDAYLMTAAGAVRKDAIVGDPRWRNYLLVPKDRSQLGAINPILEGYLPTDYAP